MQELPALVIEAVNYSTLDTGLFSNKRVLENSDEVSNFLTCAECISITFVYFLYENTEIQRITLCSVFLSITCILSFIIQSLFIAYALGSLYSLSDICFKYCTCEYVMVIRRSIALPVLFKMHLHYRQNDRHCSIIDKSFTYHTMHKYCN
mgnify:CR=1 FL=1